MVRAARVDLAAIVRVASRHHSATLGPAWIFPRYQQSLWISLCTTFVRRLPEPVVAGRETDRSHFDRLKKSFTVNWLRKPLTS